MRQFRSIERIDSAILYSLEFASSISVLLLAFGLIASMANVLTKGSILTDNTVMQQIWAWTQCIAIDASVAGTIIRTFEYKAAGEHTKMWLHAILSVFLLFTAAIVSNIESIQQTLNLTLDAAYVHVFVPVEALIWIRSVSIVLLIVVHAVRHVGQPRSVQPSEQKDVHPTLQTTVSPVQPPALPSPKNEDNYERVKTYMSEHENATVREVANALAIGTSTANKWMRKLKQA